MKGDYELVEQKNKLVKIGYYAPAEGQDRGSSFTAKSMKQAKPIHLLCRSNHTMCTVVTGKHKLSSATTVSDFESYVFGGLVYNEH